MESQEESCPLLRLLMQTKFGITNSVIQGAKMLRCNPAFEQFFEQLKDITTENCIAPEKLVKYKVCQQNNFRPKDQLAKVNHLKPISAVDVNSLEREIQTCDRVLAEKRSILQSLKLDLKNVEEVAIPKAERELKDENRKLEQNLANFLDLNNHLNTQYHVLNENTQKLLSCHSGDEVGALYHTFNFSDTLSHLIQRMNRDFYVVCKYIGCSKTGEYGDLELDIELIGKSLSNLRSQLIVVRSENTAKLTCRDKLECVRQQLKAGTFKFNMLESTAQLKSRTQVTSELHAVLEKIKQIHSTQSSAGLQSAYNRLYNIQLTGLKDKSQLLTALHDGVNCTQSFTQLLAVLIYLEKSSYEIIFHALLETHARFDHLYAALLRQEAKLQELLTHRSHLGDSVAQSYARDLLGNQIGLNPDTSLDMAQNALEQALDREKKRIVHDYSAERVFAKLAGLRERMNHKARVIYGGPMQVPILPLAGLNQELLARNQQLAEIQAEYNHLMREIQQGDSGIESKDSDFSM